MNKKSLTPNREPESNLRQLYLGNDVSLARLGLLLFMIPTVGFAFNDYQFYGLSTGFYILIATRMSLLLGTVLQLLYLNRIKNHLSYEKSIFVYTIVASIFLVIINATRPQNFVAQTIVVALSVFVFYLIIPNRFVKQTIPSLIATIGQCGIIILGTNTAISALFSVFLGLFLAIIIAALSSWQLHKYRQKGYEDIIERRQTEQALATSNEKLNDILESIHDGFFALDKNMNFTYVNQHIATIYGYVPKDVVGRNIWEIFPNAKSSMYDENFQEVLKTKIPKLFEVEGIYAQGWFEYNVYPAEDGLSIFTKDITKRKQLQDKLEEYNKHLEEIVEQRTKQLKNSERLAAIGATAGMVGHDIRNPLQAIISDVYLLNTELNSMPDSSEKTKVKESLEGIEKNVDYINKIVADLQDFARPLKPHFEEADLKQIVDEALKKSSLPENIKVTVKINNEVRKIKSDSTFLNRILYNLVNNAVQAMPKGGKLTIIAKKETNDVIITVGDTGVGISEDSQGKLFTPMFTTKSKGQGFGLAVVKRLTEALGGLVTFESEEGKGTYFMIHLPLKD